jgi:hypothetical protein
VQLELGSCGVRGAGAAAIGAALRRGAGGGRWVFRAFRAFITEMNRIYLVLFDMNNRTFGDDERVRVLAPKVCVWNGLKMAIKNAPRCLWR